MRQWQTLHCWFLHSLIFRGQSRLLMQLMQSERAHWWELWRIPGPADSTAETPLRAELFSADQMESHGCILAARHKLSPRRTRDRLLRSEERRVGKECRSRW